MPVFSSDGKRILIRSSQYRSLVWDWQLEPTKELDGDLSGGSVKSEGTVDEIDRTFPAFSTPSVAVTFNEGDVVVRDESGDRLPTGVLKLESQDPATALSADRQRLAIAGSDGVIVMRAFSDSAALLGTAKQAMPRCLTRLERKHFNMGTIPPRWCITGAGRENEDPKKWVGVWTYDAAKYRDWLVAADSAQAEASSRLQSVKARLFGVTEAVTPAFPADAE